MNYVAVAYNFGLNIWIVYFLLTYLLLKHLKEIMAPNFFLLNVCTLEFWQNVSALQFGKLIFRSWNEESTHDLQHTDLYSGAQTSRSRPLPNKLRCCGRHFLYSFLRSGKKKFPNTITKSHFGVKFHPTFFSLNMPNSTVFLRSVTSLLKGTRDRWDDYSASAAATVGWWLWLRWWWWWCCNEMDSDETPRLFYRPR